MKKMDGQNTTMHDKTVPPIRGFEDLKCWQSARELRLFVAHKVVPALPQEENYLLKPQILRSARSATANIAEGFGRHHYLDNAKFCRNASGSCHETLDHLITAVDEGKIPRAMLDQGRLLVSQTVRLINGYIRYLRKQAAAGTNPETNPSTQVREASTTWDEDTVSEPFAVVLEPTTDNKQLLINNHQPTTNNG